MKDSKEHILKTSLSLFLQKGFKAVTMNEIVKNSGFSKGAFYHYFGSKEEVFREIVDKYFSSMVFIDYESLESDSLESFYKRVIEIKARKSRETRNWFSSDFGKITHNNNFYHILFDAVRMLPDFREKERENLKLEFDVWEKAIMKAQDSKEISSKISAQELAKQFVYCSDGIALHMVMMNTTSKMNDELKLLWDSLYQSLKR